MEEIHASVKNIGMTTLFTPKVSKLSKTLFFLWNPSIRIWTRWFIGWPPGHGLGLLASLTPGQREGMFYTQLATVHASQGSTTSREPSGRG